MDKNLHQDDPHRDGNLTAEEYAASYNDPGTTGGHDVPAAVIAAALADIEARNG